jgi:EpsI family protein
VSRPGATVWLVALALLGTATLGSVLRPEPGPVRRAAVPDLARLVPVGFAGWRAEAHPPLPMIAGMEGAVERLYSQTLERTYRNAAGDQVMLSIAYGGDQRGDDIAHRPEFCYRAQGFELADAEDHRLATAHGALPVRRLVATAGARHEPVTYWMVLGGEALLPGLQRRFALFAFGLSGQVPDGLLVRVSSLGADTAAAWRLHEGFVRDLLGSLPASDRQRLAGLGSAG